MPKYNLKGVILFIVIGVIMVVSILAIAMLRIVSNQAGITEHQVNRIRAIYAAKAGMNLVFDKLRTGAWTQAAASINYYCINGPVDGITCSETIIDSDLPSVQIAVYPQNQPGIDGTARIEIKTDYTAL